MRKDKIKRVEWFLNFLNVDLDNIGYSDKLKWIVEVLNVIYHGYHDVIEQTFEEKYLRDHDTTFIAPPQKWKGIESYLDIFETMKKGSNLKQLQSCLKTFFKNFMDNLYQEISQKQEWKALLSDGLKYVQSTPIAQHESHVQVSVTFPAIMGRSEFKVVDEGKENEERFIKVKREMLNEAPIGIHFRAPKYEDTLLFNLCQALEGINIGALRQCPECGSYFLHLSRKKKIFCSNNCAARKASREKRRRIKEKKPEQYEQMKEKARDRAHESYKKKTRAKLPKATITRRPRKKTD